MRSDQKGDLQRSPFYFYKKQSPRRGPKMTHEQLSLRGFEEPHGHSN